ncbi:acyl-CoA carboxylase subunit epsilon [Kitasatospora cineracea]|uniref:acyl-CoA carboxylase subunit epsilon n=1 Tax=Kitasatospora cineracea TaxID=88074 RepID=UPI0037890497
MGGSETGMLALRVERGRASDEELAVVMAVLWSAVAGRSAPSGDGAETPNVPLWRPERPVVAHRPPHNWR